MENNITELVITKRNGEVEKYNPVKIINAMEKAFIETGDGYSVNDLRMITDRITFQLVINEQLRNVESIQDLVEKELMTYSQNTAKAYILYRQKRSEDRDKGWNLSELGKDIWHKKYENEGEGFNKWLDRISGHNTQIAKLIMNKKFLFAGRILAGRGLMGKNGRKVSLSNCYVLPQPKDNLESIFDTAKKMGRTYSYGGGCGVDLSLLRPKGSKVNNAALTTSGPVSFMELYDTTTGVIGQNARRGALMLSMSVEHPDIIDFIKSKDNTEKINHANISVRANADMFENIDEPRNKEILREIAISNWKTGEPGMLFWDNVESWHMLEHHPKYIMTCTNPCFTGDMKLLTDEGYKTFSELSGQNVNVVNINGQIREGKVWYTGDKETVKLTLSNNETIQCTPNHVFLTADGEEVEAKDMKGRKLQSLLKEFKSKDERFVRYGFIQGDGGLTTLDLAKTKGIEVHIGQDDLDIRELFKDYQFTMPDQRRIYIKGNIVKELRELGFSSNALPTRTFPETYGEWGSKQKASFLQGMYSANGCVINKHRVSYKTTCKELAEHLKETLEEDFGIQAYITTNQPTEVQFSNGIYLCKQSYDVNISRYKSLQIFHNEINFYHTYKKEALVELLKYKTLYVKSVKSIGIRPVYDFNEPDTHWGVVEGFIAHNCGEQTLPEYGNCLLGSINLSEYVKNEFTDTASIDWTKLANDVKVAVRGMNDVLDESIPLHPLKEQRQMAYDFRQIGLGIMGLSDMFIKMGVRYGSKDSIDLSDHIAQWIRNNAIQESTQLAKEFGSYPEYDYDIVSKSNYFRSLPDWLKELIYENGLRNSHLLSIAPTGSISTMIDVSGGIEPIFALSFTRTTKTLADEDTTYKVYTKVIQNLMEAKGITKEEDLPDYVITSHEVPYQERIELQATWQQYVDSAISSTINLDENATVEDIEQIYFSSWIHRLKGVTVFRNNCWREGILKTEDEKPNQEESKKIPNQEENVKELEKHLCPECKSEVNVTNGCISCPNCGWGQCSI